MCILRVGSMVSQMIFMHASERPFLCCSASILRVIMTPGSSIILRVFLVLFMRGSGGVSHVVLAPSCCVFCEW